MNPPNTYEKPQEDLSDQDTALDSATIGLLLFFFGAALLVPGCLVPDNPGVILMILSIAMIVVGVALMYSHNKETVRRHAASTLTDYSPSNPEHLVVQLTKNYRLLRRQTNFGFLMAAIFMLLGFLVILAGTGSFLGEGRKDLTIFAGIVMEFISGTAMVIYKINFTRLHETSDRLDQTWRILTAHHLAGSLPDELKGKASLNLIEALVGSPPSGRPSNTET